MENLKNISPFRLSSLLRLQKDPNLALQLFRFPNPNPSQKPFRYSALSYNLIISKLARSKMFDEMEQVLLQMKHETRFSPKESLFCNIISSYGRSRSPDRALATYDRIPTFNCHRTVRSLNSLLNALLKCRNLKKIREIYSDIDKYASPDACTYNILINARCLCDSIDDAWKLFDEMRGKGIRPNVVTFGTLISALCRNSMLDEAFRLKEKMMRVFHVKPNVFIYTSLIKGLCEVDELDSAFKLKDKMLLDGKVGVDAAVYSTLISALFRMGRKGEVVSILEEMRANGCKPDTITYNAIIAGFCNEKDFVAAFGVLNEMVEKGCKPDIFSYNTIIAGFCREGRLREAVDLFEDMPRRECTPDVVSYRTVFDGLCDGMEFKESAFVLDEMLFKGYAPRILSVDKFVEGLCHEGDMELLGKVLNSLLIGNAINVGIWKMVVNSICEKSTKLNAFELFDSLKIP